MFGIKNLRRYYLISQNSTLLQKFKYFLSNNYLLLIKILILVINSLEYGIISKLIVVYILVFDIIY